MAGEPTIPAIISKIDPNNPKDIKNLKIIKESWKENDYVNFILDEMTKDKDPKIFSPDNVKNYYAVELTGEEPLHKKLLGLLYTNFNRPYKRFGINALETHPDYICQKMPQEKLKVSVKHLWGKLLRKLLDFNL